MVELMIASTQLMERSCGFIQMTLETTPLPNPSRRCGRLFRKLEINKKSETQFVSDF
jgi:hypothetical protein